MKYSIALILIICLKKCEHASGGFFGKRVVRVVGLKGCDDSPIYKDLPMTFQNTTLLTDKTRRTFVNTSLVFHEDIKESLMGLLKVTRCQNQESPDTCEYFTTLKIPNLASAFAMKGQFWSPFTNNLNPPFRIPKKKGVATIVNGYFDGDAAPFPVSESMYWKIRFESHLKDTLISCMFAEGSFMKMKKE